MLFNENTWASELSSSPGDFPPFREVILEAYVDLRVQTDAEAARLAQVRRRRQGGGAAGGNDPRLVG